MLCPPSIDDFYSILGAAVFATVAFAQISIDVNGAAQVASEGAAILASITANPDFAADEAALATAIPSSILAAELSNPEAIVAAVADLTALPAYATAVPTSVLESLETLAAKPIEVGEAIASFVAVAISDPAFPAASSVLAAAIPTDQRAAFASDPAAFLAAGFTATSTPAYLSSLPTAIQSNLAAFINDGIAIEASILAAPVATPAPSMNTSVVPATGTGAMSPTTTGSPVPYTGAASSMNANTIGAAVMITFGFVLVLL
ncbi:hypothetical protein P7C71_g2807, partial [Lecanoromycetidae sp. Uapishka_2]